MLTISKREKESLFGMEKDLSYELFLTCRDNGNYYKRVHDPIPTRENKEHPSNFLKK